MQTGDFKRNFSADGRLRKEFPSCDVLRAMFCMFITQICMNAYGYTHILVPMLEQNNDVKGTFSELGSAQRCHRLGYEKYNFSRKGSIFQVLMEKITQCSGL